MTRIWKKPIAVVMVGNPPYWKDKVAIISHADGMLAHLQHYILWPSYKQMDVILFNLSAGTFAALSNN